MAARATGVTDLTFPKRKRAHVLKKSHGPPVPSLNDEGVVPSYREDTAQDSRVRLLK